MTAVAPDTGNPGDAITITGTNFLTGMTIQFASANATGIQVVSATSATCTAPAHAPGLVAVTVTNPGGRTATLPDAFTYEDDEANGETRAAPASRRR